MAELILLREAIRNLVQDGDTVAMEGFTHLIPFAAAHEIIRQQKKDLTLVRMTQAQVLGVDEGGDHRARLGLPGAGPQAVVTDLCILEPDPFSRELVVTSLQEGVTREKVAAATGALCRNPKHDRNSQRERVDRAQRAGASNHGRSGKSNNFHDEDRNRCQKSK